jgi:ribosomal protein S18 acetylase RimI-like enzyme
MWVFEHGAMWSRDLAGALAHPLSPPAAASFIEARREAAAALAAAMGMDLDLVLERLSGGRRCFAAWVDGRIATYGWVSQGAERIGELERDFHLAPGEAYIWDCATLPAYRRQGLYVALLRHIAAVAHDEGLRRLWIGASLQNEPSLRGFRGAGFQPVARLAYMRLGQLRGLWLAGYASAPGELIAGLRRALLAPKERVVLARGGWAVAVGWGRGETGV